MKATNSNTRNNAIFYATLWTLIPMLLSAGGVFFHFQLKETVSGNQLIELKKLQAWEAESIKHNQQMEKEIALLDSLFKDLGQAEELYHQALRASSPNEITSQSDVQLKHNLLQIKIDRLGKSQGDTGQAFVRRALHGQYQNALNAREIIRKTWKLEIPPSSCPECENKLREMEKEKQGYYEKYMACLIGSANKPSSSGTLNAQTKVLQSENMACEREKTALAKELDLYQKNYGSLIDNIKEVLTDNTANGSKRKQLTLCEDKLQLIESIVRGGAKSSNGQRANWKN